ncbi:MAG: hypothetical protein J1F07_09305 [Muribaculaceae bacterium]|nr:hypothetical protein [Muribaculaceae bacterium]
MKLKYKKLGIMAILATLLAAGLSSCYGDEPNGSSPSKNLVFAGIKGLYTVDYLCDDNVTTQGRDAIYGLEANGYGVYMNVNFRKNTIAMNEKTTLNRHGYIKDSYEFIPERGDGGTNHTWSSDYTYNYTCRYDGDKLVEFRAELECSAEKYQFWPEKKTVYEQTHVYNTYLGWEKERIVKINKVHTFTAYEEITYSNGRKEIVRDDKTEETATYNVIYDKSLPAISQFPFSLASFVTDDTKWAAAATVGLLGAAPDAAPAGVEGTDCDGQSVSLNFEPTFRKIDNQTVYDTEKAPSLKTGKLATYRYSYRDVRESPRNE